MQRTRIHSKSSCALLDASYMELLRLSLIERVNWRRVCTPDCDETTTTNEDINFNVIIPAMCQLSCGWAES